MRARGRKWRLFLCGAALLGATAAAEPDPAPPADANLFLFREMVAPYAFKAIVSLDGRRIVALANDRYTALAVPPGAHMLSLSWPKLAMQAEKSVAVEVKPGEVSYWRVKADGPVLLFRRGIKLGTKTIAADATDAARAAIARCCRYRPPES